MIASKLFLHTRVILLVGGLWISEIVLQASTCEAFIISPSHNNNNNNNGVRKNIALYDVESVYIDGQSLYEILGANPNSSTEHLKGRYKELAKLTHPDAANNYGSAIGNNNNSDDLELPDFKDVSKAWKILSDEKVRRRYDRQLSSAQASQKFNTWFRKSALSIAEKLFPITPEERDYHEGSYVDFIGGTYKGMSGHIVGDTPKKVRVRIVQEDGTEKVVMVLKRSVLKPFVK